MGCVMKFNLEDVVLVIVILMASAITGWILGNLFVHVLRSFPLTISSNQAHSCQHPHYDKLNLHPGLHMFKLSKRS